MVARLPIDEVHVAADLLDGRDAAAARVLCAGNQSGKSALASPPVAAVYSMQGASSRGRRDGGPIEVASGTSMNGVFDGHEFVVGRRATRRRPCQTGRLTEVLEAVGVVVIREPVTMTTMSPSWTAGVAASRSAA